MGMQFSGTPQERSSAGSNFSQRANSAFASRRGFLCGMGVVGLAFAFDVSEARPARSDDDANYLFNDPDVPVGGNPNGTVSVVAFFDYNCPFCRMASGPLDEVVREDGDIRLVYKDWPILTEASTLGARLALAAHRQDRYEIAYKALMSLEGQSNEKAMKTTLQNADLDYDQIILDLDNGAAEIDAVLARNFEQAEQLGLRGTPAYVAVPYLVTSALDADGFRKLVQDVRSRESE